MNYVLQTKLKLKSQTQTELHDMHLLLRHGFTTEYLKKCLNGYAFFPQNADADSAEQVPEPADGG